jgi:hypothetical protein
MIQFPMDPTPFVIPYGIVVFALPWFITAVYALREMRLLYQAGVMEQANKLSPFAFRERRALHLRFLQQNPVAALIHRRAIRWGVATLTAWVVGFALLGATLFWMDRHDLLIDHSRGLYGPDEAPNKASDATSEPAPGADSSAHQG